VRHFQQPESVPKSHASTAIQMGIGEL
jgi:hypothetical protein